MGGINIVNGFGCFAAIRRSSTGEFLVAEGVAFGFD